MNVGAKQSKKELEYGKYQYESLIALVNYNDIDMIKLNKTRALASIECVEEILSDFKEFVNSL